MYFINDDALFDRIQKRKCFLFFRHLNLIVRKSLISFLDFTIKKNSQNLIYHYDSLNLLSNYIFFLS